MTEFLFILLYAVIMGLVIEAAVLLLRSTGLEKTIARYQVISMLTGTGFTTDESSLIIDHPIRRRISAVLILFGYFSLAVIISSIATLLSNDLRIELLIIVIAVFAALILVLKNKTVTKILERKFEHEMDEQFNLEDWPMKTALALEDSDMVAMLNIEGNSKFVDCPSNELILDKDDINLLFIRRGDVILRKGLHDEKLQAGDKIMIFGDEETIKGSFSGMLSEDEK